MRTRGFHVVLASIGLFVFGCSGTDTVGPASQAGGASVGGNGTGGATYASSLGGSLPAAGSSSLGGSSAVATGGKSTGGVSPTGGANSTGGVANTGGSRATGGASVSTGGTKSTGGSPATGGSNATGGTTSNGGALATGGKAATGGSSSAGGTPATGGSKATGGASATGGTKSTGGMTSTGGFTATGGTNSGGAGGTATYNPCPTDGTACKILPFGDSITYGLQSSDGGGYREPLFKTAVAAAQKITFTGSQTNGPTTVTVGTSTVTFPRNNEGHSGWTIQPIGTSPGGISTLVPTPAFSTIPHIVLLMIGTNDTYQSTGQAQMGSRLGVLLDAIITAAPSALIVVATLTPLTTASWNAAGTAYNAQIPGVLQTRVAAGKHVVMVDMSKMPTSDLSDGIHPNDTGYAYMASIW
jgi:hypothetical protein